MKYKEEKETRTPWRGALRLLLLVLGFSAAWLAWAGGLFMVTTTGISEPVEPIETAVPAVVVVTATPALATAQELESVVLQIDEANVSLSHLQTNIEELSQADIETDIRLLVVESTSEQNSTDILSLTSRINVLVWSLVALLAFLSLAGLIIAGWSGRRTTSPNVMVLDNNQPEPRPTMTEQSGRLFIPPTRQNKISPLRLAGIIKQVWVEWPEHVSKRELFSRCYRVLYPASDVPKFAGAWFYLFNDAYTALIELSSTTTSLSVVEEGVVEA